ncbi:MAG: hypothetical protein QXE80_03245 [Pyrobaculum sp.]
MFKLAGIILDQYDDPNNTLGMTVQDIPEEIVTEENIKEAELPPQEFALYLYDKGKVYKKFPCDTPLETYTSAWYFSKTAEHLPESIAKKVASYIAKRYVEQNIPITDAVEPTFLMADDNFLESEPVKIAMSAIDEPPIRAQQTKFAQLNELVKQARKLTYQERQSLPDSVFALVKEVDGKKIRKYPLHDENHVRAAITFFAQHYDKLSPQDRATVARKIKQKAKQYGIELSEDNPINKFASQVDANALKIVYKYAAETVGNGIYKHLLQRIRLAPPSAREKYAEFYEGITAMPDLDPLGVAEILDKIDQEAGLKGKVTDAYEAVYDTIENNDNELLAKTIKTAKEKIIGTILPKGQKLTEEEAKRVEEFLQLDEKTILDLFD